MPSMFWTVILSCCGTWWHMQHPNILARQDPTIFCGCEFEWSWCHMTTGPKSMEAATGIQEKSHHLKRWTSPSYLGPGDASHNVHCTHFPGAGHLLTFHLFDTVKFSSQLQLQSRHAKQMLHRDLHRSSHQSTARRLYWYTRVESCELRTPHTFNIVQHPVTKSRKAKDLHGEPAAIVAPWQPWTWLWWSPVAGSGWAHWSTERHPWKHPMAAAKTPVAFRWIKMDKTI